MVGVNESWFFMLRVKSELSWAVYQLGASEWVGRWLDKQQQHKVCGQQQQQPWLSISRQQIMRKAHNHRRRTIALSVATKLRRSALSLGCEDNPWPILYNLIWAATLRNKKAPLICSISYVMIFLSSSLCAAQQLSNLSIAESGDSSFFFYFFCFSETVLCRSNTHRHKAVVRLLAQEWDESALFWGTK